MDPLFPCRSKRTNSVVYPVAIALSEALASARKVANNMHERGKGPIGTSKENDHETVRLREYAGVLDKGIWEEEKEKKKYVITDKVVRRQRARLHVGI